MQFTALEDFWSDETQSQYCAGLSYTATDDEIAALVERWVGQGMAELGGPVSKISGKG